MQGLGCASINFNNKACHPVPTICTYTVNRNRVDFCLQGSGDLHVSAAKQTGIPLKLSCFSLFLDDLLRFLSGICCEFDVICFLLQGGARLLGHALLLGHIR